MELWQRAQVAGMFRRVRHGTGFRVRQPLLLMWIVAVCAHAGEIPDRQRLLMDAIQDQACCWS
jgi:hypothetical protein